LVSGDALDEVHKQLRLGKLVAHSSVLLGLNTQQDQGQYKEPNARVTPPGLRPVTQVENAENQRNNEHENDGRNATRRIQTLMRDDVIEGVEIHTLSGFMCMLLKQREPVTAADLHYCQSTSYGKDDHVAQPEA